MSNIFPDLPGLSWNRKKTPLWSTKVQTAASGKELRASYYSYPKWQFSLSYEVLRDTGQAEIQSLIGLFNACKGSYDYFLYTDSDDCAVTGQSFGIGDGSTKTVGLVRSYGGFVEPIGAVNGTPTIYINGSSTSAYTITNNVLTFTSAPSSGSVLTWTGNFYYKCRFMQDSMEFNQFLHQLWEAKKVEFVSIK